MHVKVTRNLKAVILDHLYTCFCIVNYVYMEYGSNSVLVRAGGGVGRAGALLQAAAAAPRVRLRLLRGALAVRALRLQDGRPAVDERAARAHPAARAARRDRAAHEGDPQHLS